MVLLGTIMATDGVYLYRLETNSESTSVFQDLSKVFEVFTSQNQFLGYFQLSRRKGLRVNLGVRKKEEK